MNQLTFQYETIGNKSYLVTTIDEAKSIINYQLQMLANNEIPNILPVNKRQKNEEIQLCYQVTSKVSLAQATGRSKITKDGFLKLIEGSILAFNELYEYQLASSGVIFDENYIFVKPGNFEPSFVYLPIYSTDAGIAPLKEFLLGLILHSKVEITNDNFVQIILETLNSPTLNIAELTKTVNQYKGKVPAQPIHNARLAAQPQPQPEKIHLPQPVLAPPLNVAPPMPAPRAPKAEQPLKPNNKNEAPKPAKKDKLSLKKKQTGEAAAQHPKKNLFLLLQLGLLAIIVALAVSGKLNNPETHSLNFSYLLGCLIAAAGLDFVLYREWFNKDGKETSQKPAPAKNKKPPAKPAAAGIALPGRPAIPEPLAAPVPRPTPPPAPITPPAQAAPPTPAQAPAALPKAADPFRSAPARSLESDDTVVLYDDVSAEACLEYYDNGLLMRIKLDKPSVILGRMSSQVDHVINYKKIGRIHAEFICDGGNYFVKDYNSTNGTYINGNTQRIPGNTPQQIFNGDKITLADIEMTLRC